MVWEPVDMDEVSPHPYEENPMLPCCKRNAEELGEAWATALPETPDWEPADP